MIKTKIKLGNIIQKTNINSRQTILNSILENNIDIAYSCKKGTCGKCKVKLLEGKVKNCSLKQNNFWGKQNNENKSSPNYILTCISKPDSETLFLEIQENILLKIYTYLRNKLKRIKKINFFK